MAQVARTDSFSNPECIYYDNIQFIDKEQVSIDSAGVFCLRNAPIVPGSLTGTLYAGNTYIGKFNVDNFGGFIILANHLGVMCSYNGSSTEESILDVETGELLFKWCGERPDKIVVSYESNFSKAKGD